MNSRFVLALFLLSSILFLSNREGRGSVTGRGYTGAPGEPSNQYCGSFGCHFNGSFSPQAEIRLLDADNNLVNSYIPGESYIVEISASHIGNPIGYGFQIVALDSANVSGANGFSNLPPFTQEVMIGDRQYVEQSNIIPQAPILLEWTAPESGNGDVTFYSAINLVNGNGSSNGDGSDTTKLTVIEDTMLSSSHSNEEIEVSIYPNPTSDYINILTSKTIEKTTLLDLGGKQLITLNSDKDFNLSGLQAGTYWIRIQFTDKQLYSEKLIIL